MESRSMGTAHLTRSFNTSPPIQIDILGWREAALKAKPFLKWAGGKSHLLSLLLKCVPPKFGTYFEPFVGGGALFFGLRPEGAVLGDSNCELIHCYQTVRRHPRELSEYLAALTVSEDEFYRIRAMDPLALPQIARAGRFIYLNKTCFNGLYRVNKKGDFNTPFGGYTGVTLADAENLVAASRALKIAKLRRGDYSEVLKSASRGDFVYLDPPYLPVGKYSDFRRYTKDQFYESDHERLAGVFHHLASRGCHVLLSNSYHEKISRLFAEFNQITVSVPRFINCKGDGRGSVKELLISNYQTGL